ncbi:helix-turn-helix domain-containing protein [Nocardiopsis lambiniae]|uniref:Helix-turn-helix transcriptional regulator n=1 Tax=Nocardiopsis lambiniae TaxID=3075539 RepID=A0ABU2M7R6_9ACTN|nr:helix-turn-helix transcriptional regulator [Nocardiopsis sp. DSM 44743]MDT0328710.1 helix-turn-helix transcriptional regulator [Nocardiopsis sp. DSM 44743]
MATKRQVTLRAQWIGKTFKELRLRNGMTLQEVGEYLGRDQSSVSRFEAGIHPPRKDDVIALMDLFGVEEEPQRQATLHMVDEVSKTGWWAKHTKDVDGWMIDWLWLEERSEELREFGVLAVPGLLQTPRYAESIIRADDPRAPKQQIKRWVDLRVNRQHTLRQKDFRISVVLDEAVLRRPAGDSSVMSEQIKHLVASSQHENVDIRVLPFSAGAHCGGAGAFRIILMPEPFPVVAHVDSPAGALFAEAASAHELADRYDRLHQGSLDAEASREFLRKVEQELR